ncbi:MAG: stage II sporulation protein M [Peptococcaceae bacterium]|nr:stage II sporulation protein M [Peptococcaceae bacterium]
MRNKYLFHAYLRSGFWISLTLFILFSCAGWIFFQVSEPLLAPSLESLKEIANFSEGFNDKIQNLVLALIILLKNLSVAVLLVFLGHLLWGLPALFVIGLNGALLGVVARILYNKGVALYNFIFGLAPHGILELPAIFLASAVALASVLVKWQLGYGITVTTKLQVLWRVIIPLLTLAALAEVYITPFVLRYVMPR